MVVHRVVINQMMTYLVNDGIISAHSQTSDQLNEIPKAHFNFLL